MIVITGGGTGGHLSIAKSLCEAFNEEEVRPFYIGSTHGQDKTWFEGYPGFKKTIFLPTTGVVNQKGFKKMLALKNIFQQAFTCKTFFKEQNIKAVISVGGYGAAPGAFGALMCGIDLYIHEQNAINGKLNGLLKPFAKSFFSSYDENSPIKDYPVSKLFFEAYRPKKELKTLLFLGGSQGARAINDLALELAPWLNEHKIRIIHQCGDKDFQRVKSFYEKHNLDAQLFSFSKSLHEIFHEADAAIARSGAGSVWELCAAGVPALFIPYPYAAKDHQYYNAKALVDKGLATLMRQDEIEIKKVQEWILNLDVTSLSNKLHKQIEPGGAKSIAKEVLRGCQ